MAEYLVSVNSYKNAIIVYDRLILLNPKNVSYYQSKAQVQIRSKEYQSALNTINKAIQIDNKDESLYLIRAQINIALKNNTAAQQDLAIQNR